MGLEELEAVDLEALEVALALLDDCEPGSLIGSSVAVSTALSVSASGYLHADGAPNTGAAAAITSSPSKKPRKRVREYSAEADRLRRQGKKLERTELQTQVVALEQQLKRLREQPRGLSEQARRRTQAEETNKALLAELRSCSEGIGRVLQLLSDVVDSSDRLPREMPFSPRQSHDQLVRDARGTLRRAYLDIDEVFRRPSGLVSSQDVSRSSSILPRDAGDACVELTTTTPLNCGLGDAFRLVWDWIVANGHQCQQAIRYSKLDKRIEDPTMEVQSEISVLSPTQPIVFQSAFAAEKYQEPDRVVLVYTTLTALPAGAMRFREQGWICVSRPPQHPLRQSVVRTCYRLTVVDGDTSDSDPRASRLLDVRRLLIRRTNQRLRSLQHELLKSTGRIDICELAGTLRA